MHFCGALLDCAVRVCCLVDVGVCVVGPIFWAVLLGCTIGPRCWAVLLARNQSAVLGGTVGVCCWTVLLGYTVGLTVGLYVIVEYLFDVSFVGGGSFVYAPAQRVCSFLCLCNVVAHRCADIVFPQPIYMLFASASYLLLVLRAIVFNIFQFISTSARAHVHMNIVCVWIALFAIMQTNH